MDELLIHKVLGHLESMNDRLKNLEQNISALQSGQIELENGVADIKASQVRLENELFSKINVLFDGWEQHEDYALSGAKRLSHIEAQLDKLAISAAAIKSIQESHTGLLNMLSARTDIHDNEITALKRAK